MLDRIQAALPGLPPAERRVAKLALADAHAFALLPVRELALRARVSTPTVVRFCRSMGYDGLADFKRKLTGSVGSGVLTVSGGALLDGRADAAACQVPNGFCGTWIGNAAGSSGVLTVTGAGSEARLLGPLIMGNLGVNKSIGFGVAGGHTTASVRVAISVSLRSIVKCRSLPRASSPPVEKTKFSRSINTSYSSNDR